MAGEAAHPDDVILTLSALTAQVPETLSLVSVAILPGFHRSRLQMKVTLNLNVLQELSCVHMHAEPAPDDRPDARLSCLQVR